MLPELDWDDTERTLVRDESAPPMPAQRTIPLAEREVPKAEPSWKKSTVRIIEATSSDRVATLVDASASPSERAVTRVSEPPPVWDDETENTDFERIVEEAPPSDRKALERVIGKKKAAANKTQPVAKVVGNKTQPMAKRDPNPKRDPNKTKPMRKTVQTAVPDPAPTQPVAVQPDDLDQEDYETVAFERDTKTGELRPVETGVRLKRAGQALDFRRTVVGMAPPSHLLEAIEQAERRIAERRARAAEMAARARAPKARPKAMSVDDSVHVLPVIGVATPEGPAPEAKAPGAPAPQAKAFEMEPKVIVPQAPETHAMTAWQVPPSEPPPTLSSFPPPAAQVPAGHSPGYSSHPPPAMQANYPSVQPTNSSYPPPVPAPHTHSSYPPPAAHSSYPPPAAHSSYPPAAHSSHPPASPPRNWETIQSRYPLDNDVLSTAERIQRRSRMRSLVAAVLCLLFAFAAVVVAVALTRSSDGAVVRVHVQSQSGADLPLANIYLDGSKTCEATPCVLRNLEPGTHRLRVEAPGHAPHEQTIAVDKGQDRMLAVTVNRHAG